MRIPLQISFHDIDHSDAIEEKITARVGKLETFCDYITSCRVVVEHHHRSTGRHKGQPYHIRIDITLPGDELVVKREPKDPYVHDDISAAIRDAFGAMERQLQEYVTRHRRSDHRRMAAHAPAH